MGIFGVKKPPVTYNYRNPSPIATVKRLDPSSITTAFWPGDFFLQ